MGLERDYFCVVEVCITVMLSIRVLAAHAAEVTFALVSLLGVFRKITPWRISLSVKVKYLPSAPKADLVLFLQGNFF